MENTNSNQYFYLEIGNNEDIFYNLDHSSDPRVAFETGSLTYPRYPQADEHTDQQALRISPVSAFPLLGLLLHANLLSFFKIWVVGIEHRSSCLHESTLPFKVKPSI